MIKKSRFNRVKILGCLAMVLFFLSPAWAGLILQHGSRGEAVWEVQDYLYDLGYLTVAATGYYGRLTEKAVELFQAEQGLTCDGKIGPETHQILYDVIQKKLKTVTHTVVSGESLADIAASYRVPVLSIINRNHLPNLEVTEGQALIIPLGETWQAASRGRVGQIQALPWSIVDRLWKRGDIAKIIDLKTGKAFYVKRHGGHYHSDTVPLTARDTQVMFSIYGERWSWARRAVAVQIRNQYVAASINGMPHGETCIPDNNFKGHFCVHFLGSRLHLSGKQDPSHQSTVKLAAAMELPFFDEERRQPEVPSQNRGSVD